MTNFEGIRESLRTKSACTYIADNNVLDQLTWFETLNFDRVVTKEAALRYEKEQRAFDGTLVTGEPTTPPCAPPSATLSAIVRLSKEDFYMTACTDWNPRKPIPLANIRASAIAEDPGVAGLEGDFKAGWGNLVRLIASHESMRKPNAKGEGVIGDRAHAGQGFKISHKIFVKKDSGGGQNPGQAGNLGPEFEIEGWPVNEAALPALERLKATHVANPIPAYGAVIGARIRPSRYAAELRGAIVRLEFELNCWSINGVPTFTADVLSIRVLRRPPPLDTPTRKGKKRIAEFDDFDDDNGNGHEVSPTPTPSKRRQIG